jgi:hypothetical protein
MAELSGSSAVSIDHWSTPPGSPRADWDDLVRTNISRCDLMIVIVGSKSAYCEGIRNELRFAKRSNVPFFGIYAPGGSPEMSLPDDLSANRITGWQWSNITRIIDAVLGE